MKTTSFWHNLPLISSLLPSAFAAQQTTFYSTADLSTGTATLPTAELYPRIPTSAGDIIGKNIGAPLYDNISAAVRRIRQRFSRTPDAMTASAQQFAGTAPTIGNTRFTTKDAVTAAAVAAAGVMACGASGDLSDVLAKAIIFNLVGGLGLFLYGMSLMDDGLKAASGSAMKKVISTLTGNRFAALAVGAGVTGIIQSSSVTSVITLGLVDAGLMNLTQALGIVAGANIGTTMTGWLFAVKVSKYGLPLLGASAFLNLIAKSERIKNISKGTLGLGMVFLGLTTMSAGFKDPAIKESLTSLFSGMNGASIWDIGGCILISAGVTAGIQSSSATLGITIALAKAGIIPYETAVGLVLGSNIGTTITAWLAALRPGTSTEARRVAVAHSLFNIIGVLAIWPWSPTFAETSKKLADSMGFDDPGMRVAFVHTLFNVATSAAFLATLNPFERLVMKIAPDKSDAPAGFGQKRLSNALLSTPEFALEASHGVITGDMHRRVEEMFDHILAILSGKKAPTEVDQAMRVGENDLDIFKANIYHYLNRLEQQKLTRKSSATLDSQRHIANNVERMGDNLFKIFEHWQKGLPPDLPEEAAHYLVYMHQNILEHFLLVSHAVEKNRPEVWSQVKAENDRLKMLIAEHVDHWVQGSAESQIFYNNIMALYRDTLGNIKNIAEALAGKK